MVTRYVWSGRGHRKGAAHASYGGASFCSVGHLRGDDHVYFRGRDHHVHCLRNAAVGLRHLSIHNR